MNNETISTIEEARKKKYGRGYGYDLPYKEGRCVKSVWDGHNRRSFQCSRKSGHGPGNLYCKMHAKYCATCCAETWFAVRLSTYSEPEITEIKVTASTDKFIWIEGRKNAKQNSYECYFPTWEIAKSFLLNRAESSLTAALSSVQRARNYRDAVSELAKA